MVIVHSHRIMRVFFIFSLLFYFSSAGVFAKDDKILKVKDSKLIGQGQSIKGSVEAPPAGEEAIPKNEIEKWEKWEKGQLKESAAVLNIAEEQGKVDLQKLQEQIFPGKYEISSFNGDVTINDKAIKVGDPVEVKKDIVTMRGPSNITFINSDNKTVEIRISQVSEQRSRYILCDMNNPMEYVNVYYDKAGNKTVVDVGLIETTFALLVYDGKVDSLITVPVSNVDGSVAGTSVATTGAMVVGGVTMPDIPVQPKVDKDNPVPPEPPKPGSS